MNRIKKLLNGEYTFINYRKRFKGQYPIRGIMPIFIQCWGDDIWQIEWRGYAISIDMRTDWLADMVSPNRPDRDKEEK